MGSAGRDGGAGRRPATSLIVMEAPSEAELATLARACLEELPDDIRRRVVNLGFVIEEEPPEGKNWLATYQGEPLPGRSVFRPWSWPSKITIYRGPLLRLCGDDRGRLAQEMRHVVRHEIAHYFGISDERLIEIDRY
jgi:predicted Zn-dependent protease with MMP-like domain